MYKLFIDGSAGTTGLRIFERLAVRRDITLITLPEELRKDTAARKEAINSADVVFLCLPDDAAREAVGLCENDNTVIIDTSTAHRTAPGWVYGFPELSGQRERIKIATRIANPGCHASGFVSLIYPLVTEEVLDRSVFLTSFSITGYSGGGKKMISQYEESTDLLLSAPRQYGIMQNHKHLPEMSKICGLENMPAFCPIVSDFYSGMEVTVPIFGKDLKCGIEEIKEIYKKYYTGDIVRFSDNCDEGGFLSSAAFSDRDDMEISVHGNDDRVILVSRFDNLGKGASGAAIQNMNIVMGVPEAMGLTIGIKGEENENN